MLWYDLFCCENLIPSEIFLLPEKKEERNANHPTSASYGKTLELCLWELYNIPRCCSNDAEYVYENFNLIIFWG